MESDKDHHCVDRYQSLLITPPVAYKSTKFSLLALGIPGGGRDHMFYIDFMGYLNVIGGITRQSC